MKNRKGFSLIEVAMATIVLAILLTGVFRTFSSGQKMATVEMKNHAINDETQRLVTRIMDDIRSANLVDADRPGFLPEGVGMTNYSKLDERDLANPKNDKNQLVLTKLKYDFTKNPVAISKMVATYTVEKDPSIPTASGAVFVTREVAEFDDKDVLTAGPKKVTIADELDTFNFYRTSGAGPQNVYFRVIMSRVDKSNPTAARYTAKMVSSAKVRGAEPDGVKTKN